MATDDANHTFDNLPGDATRRGEDAERQVGHALQRHSGAVVPALLRPGEHRLVREHLAAELVLGFQHRRAALDLVLQSRLQSVREACNHVLVTGKTHLREQRIDCFGEVYRRLEGRMQALADGFLADADARYARLERIGSEHLRERERARQEKAAGDFLDTLDRLMDEFRAILSENVQARGGSGEGQS